MKKTNRIILIICLGILSFLFYGCGEEKKTSENKVKKNETENLRTAKSAEMAVKDVEFTFKSAENKNVLVIKRYADHDKIELERPNGLFVMKARSNKEGSRKYKESSDNESEKELVAEVKSKPDSFKLFDKNNKLLWKVKIHENKIKISDNENNENAFEITKVDATRCKVKDRKSNLLGDVKYYDKNSKLKVKNDANKEILITKDSKNIFAPGAILFEEIPVEFRTIIISEMLRR